MTNRRLTFAIATAFAVAIVAVWLMWNGTAHSPRGGSRSLGSEFDMGDPEEAAEIILGGVPPVFWIAGPHFPAGADDHDPTNGTISGLGIVPSGFLNSAVVATALDASTSTTLALSPRSNDSATSRTVATSNPDENSEKGKTAAIEGAVIDLGSLPLEGIQVTLSADSQGKETTIASTVSAEDGHFRFDGLEPGSYSLRGISAPDYETDSPYPTYVHLPAGLSSGFQIRMGSLVSVSGRIYNKETNAAIVGAVVKEDNGNPPHSATSDAAGNYFLKLKPYPGQDMVQFLATAEGFVLITERTALPYISINIAGKKSVQADIGMVPGLGVSGVVLEPDGSTPASGAEIGIYYSESYRRAETTADAEGRFRTTVSREELHVIASKAGVGRAALRADAREQAPSPMSIVLDPYAKIDGVVKTTDGEPVAAVRVSFTYALVEGVSDSQISEPSDAEGRFHLANIPPGTIEFASNVSIFQGASYRMTQPLKLDLEPGEHRSDIEIIVSKAPAITGTVTDSDGKPISNVNISGSLGGYNTIQTTTDEEGAFSLSMPSADSEIITLDFHNRSYATKHLENISMSDSPLDVVMEKAGTVQLKVSDAEGRPVTRIHYVLLRVQDSRRQNTGISNTVYTPDGFCEFPLDWGSYEIRVTQVADNAAGNGAGGSAEFVHQKDGEQVLLNIVVRTTDVEGVVVDSGGRALVGVSLFLTLPTQSWQALDPITPKVPSDAAGRFMIHNVPSGGYQIHGELSGYLVDYHATPVAYQVPPTANQPLRVVMLGVGGLEGTVTSSEGPVENASVTAYPAGANEYVKPSQTDAQGHYLITGLLPDEYNVNVFATGLPMRAKNATVAEGETTRLNFGIEGLIALSGGFSIDGEPVDPAGYYLNRMNETGYGRQSFTSAAVGKYRVDVAPGDYQLMRKSGEEVLQFSVPAQPAARTKDFDIHNATVDVVVVYPSDEAFRKGKALVYPASGALMQSPGLSYAMEEASIQLSLAPGKYKASYRSNDGAWQGESEEINVQTGAENYVVIEPRSNARRLKVGAWTPAQMNISFGIFTLDITPYIQHGGPHLVTLDFTRGNDAAVFDFVALRRNGAEISRDTHPGWSGASRRGHIYSVDVGEFVPGAVYTLDISIKGGPNSNGDVFLEPAG